MSKAAPRERWAQVSVGEAMMPVSQVRVVAPDKPLIEVLRLLEGHDVNQVPVAAGDRLVSMITRDHLLRVLAAKQDGVRDATEGMECAVQTTGPPLCVPIESRTGGL